MEVTVKVTPSMFTATPEMVHKIVGYSRGSHHVNSERIGWLVHKDGTLSLVRYSYCNGSRSFSVIVRNVKVGTIHSFILHVKNGCKAGYILRPYHGGEAKAPCNILVIYKYKFI